MKRIPLLVAFVVRSAVPPRTLVVVLAIAATIGAACTAPAKTTAPSPTPTVASVTPTVSGPAATSAPPATTIPAGPSVAPGALLQIVALQRFDAQNGWVVAVGSANSLLLRTQDGGASWQSLLSPGFIERLVFVTTSNGWAIVQSGPGICRATDCNTRVMTTDDGGRTWTERLRLAVDPQRGGAILEVAPIDAQRAWIIVRTTLCDPEGCAHEIRGTEDGGATWKVLRQPYIATQLARTSTSRGWLLHPLTPANGVEIVGTSDGGSTWISQFKNSLSAQVLAARGDRAWALYFDGAYCTASSCSSYDLVRTTDGTSWSSVGNPFRSVTGTGCGGLLSALAFGDEQTGWMTVNLGAGGAVGTGGILRTTDGGRSWICQTDPPNTVLVSAPNGRNVWVSSRERGSGAESLWSSDDGGLTWKQLVLATR